MDTLEAIWLMDSECCSTCGALLDFFEVTLCADCLENARYDQEQEQFDAFDFCEECV